MDTLLIWTPHYYGQVVLSLEEEKALSFSLKFNPLNTDTPLLWTGCFVPGEGESAYIFTKFNSLNTDTPLIWTPHCYGQVVLSLEKEKALTFLLNSTRLIRTPP